MIPETIVDEVEENPNQTLDDAEDAWAKEVVGTPGFGNACECGQGNLNVGQLKNHPRTDTHKENMKVKGWVQLEVNGEWEEMPGDFATAIETAKLDPLMAAKMVRRGFTSRHWPNQKHPGSVCDFMEEHNIPIFNFPTNTQLNNSQLTQLRSTAIKEHIYGK